MIIDCHCHGGEGDGLSGPWNTRAPLRDYLRRARAAGIDRTVLFAALHTDYERANAQVARLVTRYPQHFFGFVFVHPERDAGRIREMVGRAVRQWGFRGIKVHRKDAPATREVCEAAREFGVPLLYDVVGEVSRAELLAPEYPDVAFILPHLGSFADDWHVHVQLIDLLTRRANVFTDTSGVKRFDALREAVRRAGPDKILFGSDGPWLHPGLELHKVRLLGLSPPAERQILGGNALRLMGVTSPSPANGAPALSRPTRGLPAKIAG